MKSSTPENVIALYPVDNPDDFEVLKNMLNSPEQIRRRQVRRKVAHRMMVRRKVLSLVEAFLAGVVSTLLILRLLLFLL